jgi:hypothetical protein
MSRLSDNYRHLSDITTTTSVHIKHAVNHKPYPIIYTSAFNNMTRKQKRQFSCCVISLQMQHIEKYFKQSLRKT